LSIIKHVTLQKIVAHDFQYDPRTYGQRSVSVVKMVTVLEGCTTKQQCSVVRFLWAKGPSAKDIHEEMFHVYGWKCLSCKVVHNSQGLSKVTDDARPGAEVPETEVKILLCCRFRRTGKAMGQVYRRWWRIC
jgi:hypothetical protein